MALRLSQAAYLMGLKVETLSAMVEREEVLCIKGRRDPHTGEIMIHESELHRFEHPWKHIARLDERVNALQELVETLKKKIVNQRNSVIVDIEHEIRSCREDFRMWSEDMQEDISAMKDILYAWPKLKEFLAAFEEEKKKSLKSRVKRALTRKRTAKKG
jgi:hypothetical protein